MLIKASRPLDDDGQESRRAPRPLRRPPPAARRPPPTAPPSADSAAPCPPEFNEAFAAQALACVDELGIDPDRVDPTGGAIALGRPLGCSDARMLTTLLHRMRRTGAAQGLATVSVGVGQGSAMLVERHQRERANRTTRRDGTYQTAYLHLASFSAWTR
ncbi:hypothetical protein QFZ22_002085 [Streptomyces canus]|uniref:Thiolase C-terminal domain-containing protein n=1 Tax=Streptomyces canus TaxID=58343 RepID=A0AAW8FAJ2_9ACTN|nr:hypothetical protein [Streptomyces canus]